jgi:hypothetical protein
LGWSSTVADSANTPYRKPRQRRRPARKPKDYALAQLRGYWEPEEVEGYSKNAAGVVSDALNGLQAGLGKRFAEEEMLHAWSEIVGEFIAQHSRPIRIERKVLYIQVLQSAIHYSLERSKGDILEKMQTRFGRAAIRELRFRIG